MIIFLERKMLQAFIIHLRETSEVLSFLNYRQHYRNSKKIGLQLNKKHFLNAVVTQVILRANLLYILECNFAL